VLGAEPRKAEAAWGTQRNILAEPELGRCYPEFLRSV